MVNLEEIARERELNQLKSFKDKKLIKVITGIRRCGKSTLLNQFKNYLLENGIEENQIVYINFEDYENRDLIELDNFYEFVKSKIISGKKMYLFFDEIQQVQDFQKVVDSFYIKENIDIYITGSNSKLLSGELATLLSGRYIEIKMQPFSFGEFLQAFGEKNLQTAYKKYIETSSFPYIINLFDNAESIHTYLEGIYNSILVKDIISRKKISDVKILQSIIEFIFDNIGLEVSSKKIADTLSSSGRKTDSRTVENYLSSLAESFIVYKATRYNIKGKEHLKLLEKYYVCDIGLRRILLGRKSMDVGHILENVVYLELLRRNYKVFVGKIDDVEVDFVAMNENGNLYIQVSASVRDEKTLERELKPLKIIKDNYPKLLLTLDEDPIRDFDGITLKNVLDWLVEG